MKVSEPTRDEDTGEWVVSIEGSLYSFLEESAAKQFYELQRSFIKEIEDRGQLSTIHSDE